MNYAINFFCNFLNINIVAAYVILAVIVLRFVLQKAPKWVRMILWSFVGIRLVIPFSIKSKVSLIPSSDSIISTRNDTMPYIQSGFSGVDTAVNSYLADHYAEGVTVPANLFNDFSSVFELIWMIGIVLMLAFFLISFIRLKRRVSTAVLLRDNIYQSERVKSPFALGIFRAKIYLPYNLSEKDMGYIITHENAHIKHGDNIIKPFAFLLLSFYWFNPLVWVSYFLLCKDIELLCDERATKNYSKDDKADYSQALLSLSNPSKMIKTCPVSFGEVGVKERVRAVLNYKKPAVWVIGSVLIVCIITGMCFLTNPQIKTNLNEHVDSKVDAVISEHLLNNYQDSFWSGECQAEGHIVFATETKNNIIYAYSYVEYSQFGFQDDTFVPVSGFMSPAVFEIKADSYDLIHVSYAEDGELYHDSIKQLFPEKYVDYALNPPDGYVELIRNQQVTKYAQPYLDSINSDAEISFEVKL